MCAKCCPFVFRDFSSRNAAEHLLWLRRYAVWYHALPIEAEFQRAYRENPREALEEWMLLFGPKRPRRAPRVMGRPPRDMGVITYSLESPLIALGARVHGDDMETQ
jgi:hypothetical protein